MLTRLLDRNAKASTSQADNLQLLAAEWAPTFSAKPFDALMSDSIAHKWIQPFGALDAAPPTPDDFSEAARHARQSAPGPDGIPFAARAAAGPIGAGTPAQLAISSWRLDVILPLVAVSTCISAKGL